MLRFTAALLLVAGGASPAAGTATPGGVDPWPVGGPPAGNGPPYVWHPTGGTAGAGGGESGGVAAAGAAGAVGGSSPAGTDAGAAAAGPGAAVGTPLSWEERAQDGTFQKFGWPTAPPASKIPPNPTHPANPVQPPAPPASYISFMALADWGGQDMWPMTTVAQTQCASAMAKLASDLVHPTFIVSAGDNFYESGIKGAPPAHPHSSPCR